MFFKLRENCETSQSLFRGVASTNVVTTEGKVWIFLIRERQQVPKDFFRVIPILKHYRVFISSINQELEWYCAVFPGLGYLAPHPDDSFSSGSAIVGKSGLSLPVQQVVPVGSLCADNSLAIKLSLSYIMMPASVEAPRSSHFSNLILREYFPDLVWTFLSLSNVN